MSGYVLSTIREYRIRSMHKHRKPNRLDRCGAKPDTQSPWLAATWKNEAAHANKASDTRINKKLISASGLV